MRSAYSGVVLDGGAHMTVTVLPCAHVVEDASDQLGGDARSGGLVRHHDRFHLNISVTVLADPVTR
jgi:hypothetical protein